MRRFKRSEEPLRKRRNRVGMIAVAFAAVEAMVAIPTAAQAYTTTGQKWGNANLRIYVATTSGDYRTSINQASSNYTSSTDVNLTNTTDGGPAFSAANTNAGATGYEGHTDWNYVGGRTTSAHSILNTYYLSGAPVARLKVVWLHELGHGLGLNHVSGTNRVMYTSASTAYTSGGVRSLTSDEISGINALY